VVWTARGNPVDNTGEEDAALRPVGSTLPDGSVFRVISYGPGVAPRNHRTSSIDYAVVISGEIDMHLDDSVAHLRAGDVLVQRGTVHNWVNTGSEPCIIAFVLIDAKPVLAAEG
jgi:quercetin dioxygenase-like cupin family protein